MTGPADNPDLAMLLAVGESYTLCRGAEYLDDILMTGQGYPLPVLCIRFGSAFEMQMYLGGAVDQSQVWGINPDIVARLRRDGHLEETTYSPGDRFQP